MIWPDAISSAYRVLFKLTNKLEGVSFADQRAETAETSVDESAIAAEPSAEPAAVDSEMSAQALIPEVKWQRTSDLIMAQSANALMFERLDQLTQKVVSKHELIEFCEYMMFCKALCCKG